MLKAVKTCSAVLMLGLASASMAQESIVYTSDSSVTAWDPILPAVAYNNWVVDACKVNPDITLDANWVNPHAAYSFGTNVHPWQPGASLSASWINAWDNLSSIGPNGHNWSRYTKEVSGNGQFVLNLLADNCSWIYLDGTLVGFQGATSIPAEYPVSLDGSHTLDFLIFDGGGLAGGMFRLETNVDTTFVDTDGDGLTDAEEVLTETDRLNPDTDGDGFSDGEEVAAGTNPNDGNDFPVINTDSDGDGIFDSADACANTAAGAVVDQFGCSGVQNVANACACEGSSANMPWKNHGQYVNCVVKARNSQVNAGLLTEAEGSALVSAAAQSSCGKPTGGKGKNK